MKVKVTRAFKDKMTGDIHKVGDILDISKARAKEIKEKGDFITEAESKTKDKK